jgi:O-antigen/teichoic acid export membrane protein
VADELVTRFYSVDYQPVIPLIRILAVHIPIAAMDTVLAIALIASNRQNKYVVVSAIAAVFNPIACVVLINATDRAYDNGAIGAAIVTVATELFVMAGAIRLKSPGVLDRSTISASLRCVAAGLVLVPVLFVADPLPLPVQIALGIAVYGIAALLLRVIRISELREMLGSTGSERQPVPEPID